MSLPFYKSSGSREVSMSIAFEARRIVRNAAEPVPPGSTVKAQMRSAAIALGYPVGSWRIRAAWNGEASSWSAEAFELLRNRHRLWRSKQEARADAEGRKLSEIYTALAGRLGAKDAEFHRNDIDALLALVRRIGARDEGPLK